MFTIGVCLSCVWILRKCLHAEQTSSCIGFIPDFCLLLMPSCLSFSVCFPPILLCSMEQSFAGFQWTGSSLASLRSSTSSSSTSTALLTWRWWSATLTSTATCCRLTTTTTSAKRFQQLIPYSGYSYKDKVNFLQLSYYYYYYYFQNPESLPSHLVL